MNHFFGGAEMTIALVRSGVWVSGIIAVALFSGTACADERSIVLSHCGISTSDMTWSSPRSLRREVTHDHTQRRVLKVERMSAVGAKGLTAVPSRYVSLIILGIGY